MWETLYEDFEDWTADSLLKAGRDLCRELREVLIKRGVKVEENSRIAISERIYKAIITEYNQYLVPQVPTENIEEFSGKVNRQSYENDIDTKFDRTIPKPSQKPISTSIFDSKFHNIELSSDFVGQINNLNK
ncbi:hypothetical protein GcC1_194031, partial [Golovinomyces cichoracearum]